MVAEHGRAGQAERLIMAFGSVAENLACPRRLGDLRHVAGDRGDQPVPVRQPGGVSSAAGVGMAERNPAAGAVDPLPEHAGSVEESRWWWVAGQVQQFLPHLAVTDVERFDHPVHRQLRLAASSPEVGRRIQLRVLGGRGAATAARSAVRCMLTSVRCSALGTAR